MAVNAQSSDLHGQTEKPGMRVPREVHRIIALRYRLAVELSRGRRTLEVGCGAGLGVEVMLRASGSYVAGEFSNENLAILRKHWGNRLRLIRMDAHFLPFPPESFEVVLALAMIYYLDLSKFLEEARRILIPDGRLFFCTSNPDVPGFVPSPFTTSYYGIPALSSALAAYGFTGRFQGAFPAAGGSLMRRRWHAAIKTAVKGCVHCLPGGQGVWADWRRRSQGEHSPLPMDINLEIAATEPLVDLNPVQADRQHRIVYVEARRSQSA
jgi:SAM-dependent methyltransferase